MKVYAVISAMGTDRVGLVDDLSDAILAHNCNVEESRMAVLGGEFAAIVLASGEPDPVSALVEGLPAQAGSIGLHVEAKTTTAPRLDAESRPYLVECVSLDSPGIVHAITSLLRRHQINVEDLETDTTSAPWTGAPQFVMRARVSIPARVSLSRLRDEFDDLASEQDLDIRLAPVSTVPRDL